MSTAFHNSHARFDIKAGDRKVKKGRVKIHTLIDIGTRVAL